MFVFFSPSLYFLVAGATQYASHDLGGITRKVYLLAVPEVSLADVHVVTLFPDSSYTSGVLCLNISVANDGAAGTSAPVGVSAVLAYQGQQEVTGQVSFAAVAAGAVAYQGLNLSVAAPPLWDPEHVRPSPRPSFPLFFTLALT